MTAVLPGVYEVMERSRNEAGQVLLTAEEAVPTVAVIRPLRGLVDKALKPLDTIGAWYQAPIYARVSGYLKMGLADIGARVKAGDPPAIIETPELDQQLAQSKVNLAVANANQRLAQVAAARWQKLLKSDAALEQHTDVRIGDAAAKQAGVTAPQTGVPRLESLANFKRIVTSFDGIIAGRRTNVGALIYPSGGIGSELFAAVDLHSMRV
jgi:multidrug efflux pump subunit AcrA (membrane-fusion protein)